MALKRRKLFDLLKSFLPDVGAAVCRFPLASLIAAIFTLLHLADADKILGLGGDAWMRLSFGLGAAFLLSVAVSLHAERRGLASFTRYGAEIFGFASIAALYAFPLVFSFQPQLFFLGCGILCGLAPYAWQSKSNAAFWQFNHHLWLGAGLALVGAVMFSGGLSLIVEALKLLFEFKLPRSTHENIWTLGFGLIAPLNWLSLVPRDFAVDVQEGEQKEFTSNAVAVIVKYILVPLLLVYTAILYAYAVKIGIDGVLPKGRLGPMVLAYGAIGSLTVLFVWPTRKTGGPLVKLFWRHWFWLTLGPVALMFLAAYKRINQYGVTEERYLVVLAGIWLVAMAVWYLFSRQARNIRILPASLCLLLLLSSFGPWGAIGLSVSSQKNELAQLLEANGRLKDGGVVKLDSVLPRKEGNRAALIIRYLQRHEQLEALSGWFAEARENPFAPGQTSDQKVKKLAELVGAPIRPLALTAAKHLNFRATRAASFPIDGYDQVIGPVVVTGARGAIVTESDAGPVKTVLKNGTIEVLMADGAKIIFDLVPAATEEAKAEPAKPSPRSAPIYRDPLKIESDDGSLLLVETMWGRMDEDLTDIRRVNGWLLLKQR